MERAAPAAVADRILSAAARGPLLLLCDFDGTLCEFQADPAAVWLPDGRRDLLAALADAAGTTVGLISGRRLDDVRMRSRLSRDDLFVAGLHGLEIEGGGRRFVHPDTAGARARARAIAAALQAAVEAAPGSFIEDKGLSTAVHYREASPEDGARLAQAFDRAVVEEVEAGHVRVMRGACVLEALPNIDWNKGNALEWIRTSVASRGAAPFVVYFGDDVTDEDAFRVVRTHGLGVAASDRVIEASLQVDGPPEIEQVLARLAAGR